MSWQLASFAIVIGALVVAFWWYEQSHPSAKLLAVVATLAALAALGRDAFAAVPDVKPITAIVLVSGVAFGAGPGFAVGAISGLASNILLGAGALDALADARLGARRVDRSGPGQAAGAASLAPDPGAGLCVCGRGSSTWCWTSRHGRPPAITAWPPSASSWARRWSST